MKLRRWDEAERVIRDASDRDALSLTCAFAPCFCRVCCRCDRRLTPCRYLAFLLARRCEFDSSAQLLLQIWEQGGGSDLTNDRLTHFLLLSFDSARVRSWSRSEDDGLHDCTAGVFTCSDPSPPLPAASFCDRQWDEYSGTASSRSIASAAAAARKLLKQVLSTAV
jgi:hypothetical protein